MGQSYATRSDIDEVLQRYRSIAIVGLSGNPEKDSYRVANYMKENGYRVIPVNPNYRTIIDEECYPSLLDVPDRLEIVNIFRKPETVAEIVDQAILKNASAIWMQEGIVSDPAAEKAREAGLKVIMDRCIMVEHRALMGRSDG
jgi:predicted CoA-binding protein